MTADRSLGRNVHIYNTKDHSKLLGGLTLNNGITKSNLYSIVEIWLLFDSSFSIENDAAAILQRNEEPLVGGKYYIVGSFIVNGEPCLTRTISLSTGNRLKSFRDEVRKRDDRCVVTDTIATGARYDYWRGFHAAHIFPLAYEEHWTQQDYSRWITIPASNGDNINSKQNGLLLRSDIHELFDGFDVSINPDDNYKVFHFLYDGNNIAGKLLSERFRNDPERPPDELLRWHFRQAVLTNIRGVGEPSFEIDFPPGSDMLGEIREGPKAAERMEFELFSRLAVSIVVPGTRTAEC